MIPAESSPPGQRGFILTALLLILTLVLVAIVGLAIYALSLDGQVRSKFEGKRWAIPAKVYSRPLELYTGAPVSRDDVLAELELLHYNPGTSWESPGVYTERDGALYVHTRGFVFSDETEKSQVLKLKFSGRALSELASTEQNGRGLVRLEPLVIGGIYPSQNEDRVLMQLKDSPKFLIDALIATEDRDFYHHFGISVRGILRAIAVNIMNGELRQGGSTLTQQLVKNFYLTDERSLKRKLNEALMAMLLETHYSKNEILECYLNEVNLGQNGNRSINGFGLASQFYFGQPISELSLSQVALLVGLVKGPSFYNPWRNPDRALARRNTVLDNMLVQGRITRAQYDKAHAKSLGILIQPTAGLSLYPAFMDVVRRQLKTEYKEEDLSSEGLRIFTTLDPRVQNAAGKAFNQTLGQLRARSSKMQDLQGSVVVANPENGELLAVIGGYGSFTGFNRALDANRQVGSLLKPAVYLTALASGQYNLLSPLDDSAVEVAGQSGSVWRPENYDHQDHGIIPLYDALAHSYNQATIRLGMTMGIPTVIKTLKDLGVTEDLPNYPSLLLGTVDMSPMEVLRLYQPFAANGFQTTPRAIREVVNTHGKRLTRYGLDVKQVYDPAALYQVNYAMQQVMRSGTASAAYARLPGNLVMAGKTGTTNDLRDAWFAGYTGNYLAVVWVGNDDNRSTGLSGASGALPVWVDIMTRLHPVSLEPAQPDTVSWVWADRSTGKLSAEGCPGALYVPMLTTAIPVEKTFCAAGKGGDADPVSRVINGTVNKFLDIFR
ncbi:penicillin-binding protein 1B [Fluviicoccus keumensis]|uniref:Penicillin-binding protein 1B n=1 Tax=Fluviicoccus keumensis TaxID=1435465 RepID=A0A4Q7Z9H6_9GAMM|nr:penicillin-binding protein 1B [Fluviicoccus keumensis]RZU47197.1 penicillin-binding protein 1B [Fluviicoccus keumensis]